MNVQTYERHPRDTDKKPLEVGMHFNILFQSVYTEAFHYTALLLVVTKSGMNQLVNTHT